MLFKKLTGSGLNRRRQPSASEDVVGNRLLFLTFVSMPRPVNVQTTLFSFPPVSKVAIE